VAVVLSVAAGTLTAVAPDVPAKLRDLAELQHGIVSRRQLLSAGVSDEVIGARLRRASWQRRYPGVYALFSGDLSREAELWAAVLHAGPGAALSHQTSAELQGLGDAPSSLIHLTVPAVRRVRRTAGIVIHLSACVGERVHPVRTPPQTRVEETILDLWQSARTMDEAVSWATRGIGRRLTTQDKLREAMAARSRVPRRRALTELLSPDLAGVHSVLEYRYVRDVERPHGFPPARRQASVRRGGHNEYLDLLYEEQQTVVELDGRLAHPGDAHWRDIRRDNATTAGGRATLRYGWLPISTTPCDVAAEVGSVLMQRGWRTIRPCSLTCPVRPDLGPRRMQVDHDQNYA
jgi:very-short-patch-repair endonuclease